MTRRHVIVYHDTYGCDTGCCGHVIEIDGATERFEFNHPNWTREGGAEDPRAFAERFVREEFGDEHVADLDWDACSIVND